MTRGKRALLGTITLSIIAATLGAWLAYIVFASEDANPNVAQGATSGDSVIHPNHGEDHQPDGLNHTADEHASVPIADLMAEDPDRLAYCVGASMEPFEGAMTQLRDNGPAEVAERMRTCVFEVIIGHGDDATMVELETHRANFFACFGALQNVGTIDKPAVVEQTTACILDGIATN